MGQVEPDALREKDVLRQEALTDVVRGESAITRAGHTSVLGERPQPVEDTKVGTPGKQPKEEVEEGLTEQGEDGEHEQWPLRYRMARIRRPALNKPLNAGLRFLYPEIPTVSRTSLRRSDAFEIG